MTLIMDCETFSFHRCHDTIRSSRTGDWVWDGKDDVDEDIYFFKIVPYDPGSTFIEEATDTFMEVESPQTRTRRREWENQKAIASHFEEQLKQLKSKQQSLFRSLSEGFRGNLKRTMAHVTAVSQAHKDIEALEGNVTNLSNNAMVKRWEYLTSCNEDDQHVMIEAQERLNEAQERLANTDPMET